MAKVRGIAVPGPKTDNAISVQNTWIAQKATEIVSKMLAPKAIGETSLSLALLSLPFRGSFGLGLIRLNRLLLLGLAHAPELKKAGMFKHGVEVCRMEKH